MAPVSAFHSLSGTALGEEDDDGRTVAAPADSMGSDDSRATLARLFFFLGFEFCLPCSATSDLACLLCSAYLKQRTTLWPGFPQNEQEDEAVEVAVDGKGEAEAGEA